MNSRLKFVFVALPVVVLALVPVASWLFSREVEARQPAASFAPDGEARLLADLEHSREVGFFATRGTARDAAPVLNTLVASDPRLEGATLAWWARSEAFADLASLRREPDGWLNHPEVTDAYDVSFLAEWRGFDHWNWAGTDPYRSAVAEHPDLCVFEAPTPNTIPFLFLAKVRMAQGYWQDDLAAAVADTEHLAMLVYSTDTLVGGMVAVSILGIEDHVIQQAVAGGKAAPARTWGEADLARLKPAVMATSGVFMDDPNSELARTLVDGATALPGVCAGIAGAALTGSMLRPYVTHPWPGEVDHSGAVTGLDYAFEHSGCAVPRARDGWVNGDVAHCYGDDGSGEELMLRIPYLRAPLITLMRGVALPNYLGPYGNDP